MPFPHKTATEIEYLRELAKIASTLAACNEHECLAAAGLIGQEIQEALRPPVQEDHPKTCADSLGQAVSYAQASPGPTLGETGIPLSPIDSAVAEATRAKIELDRFSSSETQGYVDAFQAYNQAMGRLADEIGKAAQRNPDIGTAVSPIDSFVEDVKRLCALRDKTKADFNASALDLAAVQEELGQALRRLSEFSS